MSATTNSSLTQLGQSPLGNLATLTGLAPSNSTLTIESSNLSAVNSIPSIPPIINTNGVSSIISSVSPPSPSSSVLNQIPGVLTSSPTASSVLDVQNALGSLQQGSRIASNLSQSAQSGFNTLQNSNINGVIQSYNNGMGSLQQPVPLVNSLVPSTVAGSAAVASAGNLTPSRISLSSTPQPPTPIRLSSTPQPPTPNRISLSGTPSRISLSGTPNRISLSGTQPPTPIRLSSIQDNLYTSGKPSTPSRISLSGTQPTPINNTPIPSRVVSSKLSSSPQRQVVISSAAGPIQNDDVEVMLLRHSYIPEDRIFTKDANGQIMGRFIKVQSPSGSSALVDINVPGVMAVAKNDMTTIEIESGKALDIPLDVKTGTLSCAGNGVCGVAFECSNGICTISRGADMQPKETNFVKVSEVSEEAAVIGSTPFAIPIVKLSEILENPIDVDKKINSSTSRIYQASFMKCQEDVKSLQGSIGKLNSEYNALTNNLQAASNNITVTINELRAYNNRFYQLNPDSKTEIDKHNKVVEELKARNELYEGLFRICKIVSSNIDAVDALTKNFSDINNVIRKDYRDLDRKITEPLIKSSPTSTQ